MTSQNHQQIVYHTRIFNSDVKDIITHVFMGQNPNARYLQQLEWIQNFSANEILVYILGPLKRGGGNQPKLSALDI